LELHIQVLCKLDILHKRYRTVLSFEQNIFIFLISLIRRDPNWKRKSGKESSLSLALKLKAVAFNFIVSMFIVAISLGVLLKNYFSNLRSLVYRALSSCSLNKGYLTYVLNNLSKICLGVLCHPPSPPVSIYETYNIYIFDISKPLFKLLWL
jgi:hypothetical protein